MRNTLLSLSFVLLLGACGAKPVTPTKVDTLPPSGPLTVDRRPMYAPYTPGAVGYGRSSILFFASGGDEFSRKSDKALLAAYASGTPKLSTYKVDFAAADREKLTYSVFIPDTFVLLDARGDRIGAVVHPSSAELQSLLLSGALLR